MLQILKKYATLTNVLIVVIALFLIYYYFYLRINIDNLKKYCCSQTFIDTVEKKLNIDNGDFWTSLDSKTKSKYSAAYYNHQSGMCNFCKTSDDANCISQKKIMGNLNAAAHEYLCSWLTKNVAMFKNLSNKSKGILSTSTSDDTPFCQFIPTDYFTQCCLNHTEQTRDPKNTKKGRNLTIRTLKKKLNKNRMFEF